jgi:hypothetical protein
MELLCYTVILGNKPGERIGIVKYGETGYYLTDFDNPSMTLEDCKTFVADRNKRLRLPEDVAESMQYASVFGWDAPIADRAKHYMRTLINEPA